jgi:hypothetical protein
VHKSIRWFESASELSRSLESAFSGLGRGEAALVASLLYLLFRRVLAVAALRLRSREFKELEIVLLRHELAVSSPPDLPPAAGRE